MLSWHTVLSFKKTECSFEWHESVYSLECIANNSFKHSWQIHVKWFTFRNSKIRIPRIGYAPPVFHIQNLPTAKANYVTDKASLSQRYLQSYKKVRGYCSYRFTHLQMGLWDFKQLTISLLAISGYVCSRLRFVLKSQIYIVLSKSDFSSCILR